MKINVRITSDSAWKGKIGYITGGHGDTGVFFITLSDGLRMPFFGSEFEFVSAE